MNRNDEVAMVTVDCPFCDTPVALERPELLLCDDCRVELSLDAAPAVAAGEVALAA